MTFKIRKGRRGKKPERFKKAAEGLWKLQKDYGKGILEFYIWTRKLILEAMIKSITLFLCICMYSLTIS